MTRPSEAEVTELMSVGQCEACGGPTVSLARHICEPCKARALSTPPLPSAEPDGWEVRTFFEDGKLLDAFCFLDDPSRATRIREYIASGRVRGAMTPLYRTTPPAAAQDTAQSIRDAFDALALDMGSHWYTASRVRSFCEKYLDAARAAGGE